ncbi:sucrose-6-phosphate hydrolase [Lactiplantibacillus xiangfangensis]|uniref:Sucrose-6-phosphate hydrolase n=2 Tax=Lactiplantibacillus xiangfangensis TaxID=942150 RepID=A0A0R2MB16_9LACO|nr:sucrose-6-phosphate hydrolase [Lactiplantibacillus xiangfangensis]
MTNLKKRISNSNHRLAWHIQPPTGLLNDPNGFSYFNHEWHLFYQYYPYGPVHGLKSWYHVTSKDLIHWESHGIALYPDTPYDSQGVYSGSALPLNDRNLLIMYTGNVRDQAGHRQSYQNYALMSAKGTITKERHNPIIQRPDNVTEHFRDPQLIQTEHGYYALLGAQRRRDLSGQINVFKSTNLHHWENLGFLNFTDIRMGYMIECPNLIQVDGQPLLIFCPQGLSQKDLAYDNNYPNTYLIGNHADLDQANFDAVGHQLTLLDEGFDCYATQVLKTPDGRALAITWVGLPDMHYPTDKEGWSNCLSMVKELHIKNGKLYQMPLVALSQLRQNHQHHVKTMMANTSQALIGSNSYELQLTISADQQGQLKLMTNQEGKLGLTLKFDTKSGQLTVQRQCFTQTSTEQRTVSLTSNKTLKLRIFVDHSLVEIFVNNGERVFTQRVFVAPEQTLIKLVSTQQLTYNSDYWDLQSTVK